MNDSRVSVRTPQSELQIQIKQIPYRALFGFLGALHGAGGGWLATYSFPDQRERETTEVFNQVFTYPLLIGGITVCAIIGIVFGTDDLQRPISILEGRITFLTALASFPIGGAIAYGISPPPEDTPGYGWSITMAGVATMFAVVLFFLSCSLFQGARHCRNKCQKISPKPAPPQWIPPDFNSIQLASLSRHHESKEDPLQQQIPEIELPD